VAAAVAKDANGIGFVPSFAVGAARPVKIGDGPESGFHLPTHAAVRAGTYPPALFRYVYLYVPETKPEALTVEARVNWENAREFADLTQSWLGQAVVAASGFITELAYADMEGALSPRTSESVVNYVDRLVQMEKDINRKKTRLTPELVEGVLCARLVFDRVEITPTAESLNTIQTKLPSWLRLYGDAAKSFTAEGWTDDLADDETSQIHSRQRAEVVAGMVTSITGLPCKAVGKGKSNIPANTSEVNKRMNRSVVLKLGGE
jgi:hypothetical protein